MSADERRGDALDAIPGAAEPFIPTLIEMLTTPVNAAIHFYDQVRSGSAEVCDVATDHDP